jgi:hypothetical protein
VGQTTIVGPEGLLGYIHDVLVIEGSNRTEVLTGTCAFAAE